MASDAFTAGLALFQESTQGTGPTDAADWNSNGDRLHILAGSLDVTGLVQAGVEDERAQEMIMGLNRKVRGLRNAQFPFKTYLTGSGADTGAASQITQTLLMTLLEHELGGIHLSNQTVLAGGGHTTTSINVTANTNVIHGQLAFIQDISTGEVAMRRVLDVDALNVDLDMALPFTPVDGDLLLATATLHIDESKLVDSRLGPYTLSLLAEMGYVGGTEAWECNGCKCQLDSIELSRGGLPTLNHTALVASFNGPDDAPNPTWTQSPVGNAPLAIGPTSTCNVQDYGTTTNSEVHSNTVEITVGVPAVRIETNTEVDDNMEGTYGYGTQPADTIANLNLVPVDTGFIDDWQADTFKVFRWFKSAAEGGLFGVQFPRCEVVSYPTRAVANAVQSLQIGLRAHPDLANADATDMAMWRSKILIGIA